jgi:hypothetical protein
MGVDEVRRLHMTKRLMLLLALVAFIVASSSLPALAQGMGYCAWYWDDWYGWYYWCY